MNLETLDNMDPEMLSAFAQELAAIKAELAPIPDALKLKPIQPALVERFGQIIDRVYGTAATLGFKELAEYTQTIKTVCYKASQSDNIYAYSRVRDLLWVCVQNFDRFGKSVQNPKMIRQLRKPLIDERLKAESLLKCILGNIQRGSTL